MTTEKQKLKEAKAEGFKLGCYQEIFTLKNYLSLAFYKQIITKEEQKIIDWVYEILDKRLKELQSPKEQTNLKTNGDVKHQIRQQVKAIESISKGENLPTHPLSQENKTALEDTKIPIAVILDDNEYSIMQYAREYPENWEGICRGIDNQRKKVENSLCGTQLETRSETGEDNLAENMPVDADTHADSNLKIFIKRLRGGFVNRKKFHIKERHRKSIIDFIDNIYKEVYNKNFCGDKNEKCMTKKELKETIQRMVLENDYNVLSAKQIGDFIDNNFKSKKGWGRSYGY